MRERSIKFLVNPRDIEILRTSLVDKCREVKKLSDNFPPFMEPNPFIELEDYMEDLLTKLRNLQSHHPYKVEDK